MRMLRTHLETWSATKDSNFFNPIQTTSKKAKEEEDNEINVSVLSEKQEVCIVGATMYSGTLSKSADDLQLSGYTFDIHDDVTFVLQTVTSHNQEDDD